MHIPDSEIVHKVTTLIGFSGKPQQILGEISLAVYAEGLKMTAKLGYRRTLGL